LSDRHGDVASEAGWLTFTNSRMRVNFKGWGAGLVTVAVGTVVGVGGAGYVVAVAEARGQRGVNDVGDALSSVVEVGWVCWSCWISKGKALCHVSTSCVGMKNGRNVVG